ncbi:MAG: HPr family phosphocarrier protein [Rhizobiales bacterium TMED143]|nr:HPr family phosphocarrier protein [Rhodobiaceae bacterium]MBL6787021.1 HPr family phosphocarrier protein [PS1 clade bacterium]OUV92180.1 MAG: HPr family phosphocarrier protein [Rhizobiales bacterium TMED143]|tara:strand:+ start:6996 stop:7262 length:267 start_codon:yes stop_codon:yes gene_type:complete
MIERTLMIANRRGLHARASAKFVKCAEAYQAEIFVRKDDDVVPATSIMGLMMLGASLGSQIVLQASGSDAEAAIDALTQLVEGKFDEA